MDTQTVKKTMAKDTALYLPAKVLEGILGMAILNIFTSFFFTDPGVYSLLVLGTTSVNMINLAFIGWISQSSTRFVSQYQLQDREADFFKTISAAWASLNLGIVCLACVLYFFFSNILAADIYFLYLFMFIGYSMVQILLPLLAFMRRIKLNLTLSVSASLFRLLFTYILVVILKNNEVSPVAALLGYAAADTVIASVVIWRLKLFQKFKAGKYSKDIFQTLFAFSLPFLGVNITTALLNLSDRLVLPPLAGPEQMGIYSANYVIPSTVFGMISMAVMRGVYPILLKSYRKDDPKHAAELLSQAIRYFLLLALPAVTGLAALSSRVSGAFIGSTYQEGGYVISFVAVGMFCYGLMEYSNKAWEISENTRPIFKISLISALVNILVNILFIPIYGYRVAAVSTFLSFLLYLCLSVAGSRKQLKWYVNTKSLLNMLLSCSAMFIVLYGLQRILPGNLLSLILLVLAGGGIYFLVMFTTGEMKDVTRLFRKRNVEGIDINKQR